MGGVFLVVLVAVIAVLSFIVMSLWNWLVPALFHGPAIEYGQAFALLVLSRILFGSWRGRGGWHGHWRQRMWRERWEQMTPEERERLREKFMKGRCGHHHGDEEGTTAPPTA